MTAGEGAPCAADAEGADTAREGVESAEGDGSEEAPGMRRDLRSLAAAEMGDCPYGVGDAKQYDSNGKLLRRGDHILRRGAGLSTQHAIYVGDPDGRTLIYYRRISDGAGRQRAVFSRLEYAEFAEFRASGDVYRVEYGL